MIVDLVYKTSDMEKGKVRVICNLTKKSAIEKFKQLNNDSLEYAYIRKFDKWSYYHVKILKGKTND